MAIEVPLSALPIKHALTELIESAKEPIKTKLQRYTTNKNIKQIYEHLRSIGKIRTIWQTDRPAPIKGFYYPQKVNIDGETISINNLSDLAKISNRVIIQGIVGQGKSIFLRYLCIEELKKFKAVPVFLELRKFKKDKSLTGEIRQYLGDIGLDESEATFKFLAESNKLILLLDAYDELDEAIDLKVYDEIESFCRKHPAVAVVVTSRPNYTIQSSTNFTIASLSPLTQADLKPILDKLCQSAESSTEIYKGIMRGGNAVLSLLTTPLMVTLLVFVYKADQKIPAKPIEFYDSLFPTVLSRHDKLKPGGVNRHRRTKISDTSFKKIFDCISFLSSQEGKTSLKETIIISFIDQAKAYYKEDFNTEDLLSEICRITCFILKEGFDYNYLHKSIQEYHASKFITSLPELKAVEFYKTINEKEKWRKWREQITFLVELDRYRCFKYFILPAALSAKEIISSPEMVANDALDKCFGTVIIDFIAAPSHGADIEIEVHGILDAGKNRGLISTTRKNYVTQNSIITAINVLNEISYNLIDVESISSGRRSDNDDGQIFFDDVNLLELLSSTGKRNLFATKFLDKLTGQVNSKIAEATEILQQFENTEPLFKL